MKEEKLILIETLPEFKQLAEYIKDKTYIAFDTETTGIEKDSAIIGFSICAEHNVGYYVVLYKWHVNAKSLESFDTIYFVKDFLNILKTKQLIMHNGVFDCHMVESSYKIKLIESLHTDTLILAHLLNENRHNGLKELGVSIFGDSAAQEQKEMKVSVLANGGSLTKNNYELYKADYKLIGKYGAKDAILTFNLFHELVPKLYEENLDTFFYEDESMPLLRHVTYDLNTTGLRVDTNRLIQLKGELEAKCLELKASIYKEIDIYVKEKYPGKTKKDIFNIGSSKQLSWLLFIKLDNEFNILTKEGKTLCKALNMPIPYTFAAKRDFIKTCQDNKNRIYEEAKWNPKTKKLGRPKKIGDVWNYLASDKSTLQKYAQKYKWVKNLLEYSKNLKILNTYVIGIQERLKYNIIRPSFLQHGTTSGRFSSRNPNFQNLPRDDKRVKSCIISRPGKIFVGADYSQLEPRVFASFSRDARLINSFKTQDDFYSVVGIDVFDKYDAKPIKEGDPYAFGVKYKELRQISKTIALAATYSTTASKTVGELQKVGVKKTREECQLIIDTYFEKYPDVYNLMIESHETVKTQGYVTNLFGRKRRIPQAKSIDDIYGTTPHHKLPYEIRNLLNLAINHRIQSTGASIINRAAIAFKKKCNELAIGNNLWNEVKIVMQIHDELIVEGPETIANEIADVLKLCMETTIELPQIELEAIPKIAYDLGGLK